MRENERLVPVGSEPFLFGEREYNAYGLFAGFES